MNSSDGRLSLDDPRWGDLQYRNGSAAHVPEQLRYLLAHPEDLDELTDLLPYLCSEGTAWPSAYATAPYLIDMAKQLPPKDRFDHVYTIGYCEMNGVQERDCPGYLLDAYQQAVEDALSLAGTLVSCEFRGRDTRHLIVAIAALQGFPRLADTIGRLDCGCPHCDGELLPESDSYW